MRSFFGGSAVLALLVCAVGSFAATLPPLVHVAAPGVWYRQSEDDKRIIATTSWIEFKDFIVVIDANFPWGAKAILEDLRQTTSKPVRFVFDTHYHGDHSYGNGIYASQGVTVVSSDATAADSASKDPGTWAKNTDTGVLALKQYPQASPVLTFHDRIAIDDGTRHLDLIRLGPGHTPGDAVAWLPKERIVFTGDLCTTRAQNNLSDAGMSPEGWLKALDTMLAWDPEIVIPGHGIQGTSDALRGQRGYLEAIFEGVREGIAHGKSVEELQKSIDLSSHKPWSDSEQRNAAAIAAAYKRIQGLSSTAR